MQHNNTVQYIQHGTVYLYSTYRPAACDTIEPLACTSGDIRPRVVIPIFLRHERASAGLTRLNERGMPSESRAVCCGSRQSGARLWPQEPLWSEPLPPAAPSVAGGGGVRTAVPLGDEGSVIYDGDAGLARV